jgi:hypothetical protein
MLLLRRWTIPSADISKRAVRYALALQPFTFHLPFTALLIRLVDNTLHLWPAVP